MEEDSALIAVAEIAVAIAGFSGIAAALRHGNKTTWPAADRNRFILLVGHSGIALFSSLTPLIFAHRAGLGPEIWSTSSLCWAGFAVLGIGFSLAPSSTRISMRSTENLITLILFSSVMVFQIYNGLVLKQFWPYFASLVVNLAFAFAQFMALAIPKPAD